MRKSSDYFKFFNFCLDNGINLEKYTEDKFTILKGLIDGDILCYGKGAGCDRWCMHGKPFCRYNQHCPFYIDSYDAKSNSIYIHHNVYHNLSTCGFKIFLYGKYAETDREKYRYLSSRDYKNSNIHEVIIKFIEQYERLILCQKKK